MKKYDIKKYFLLQNHPDSDTQLIRYYMIGIFNSDNEFTGIIYDYMGGGSSGDEYFVDGVSTQDLDNDGDPVFNGCDEAADEMEEKYPGLYKAIYKTLDKYTFSYVNEDGTNDYYIKADKMKFFDDDGNYIGDSSFVEDDCIAEPISIGNTYFN